MMLRNQNRLSRAHGWYAVGVGLLLSAYTSVAQVSVGIKLDQLTLMVNEASTISIVIRNESETPLVFNKKYHNAEIQVSVQRDRASMASGFVSLKRDFVVMPDEFTTELVELTSLADISAAGIYRVSARVRYDGKLHNARPKSFDVAHGIELASRNRSLSGYKDVQLTYSLRYCARKSAEYAFLVVEDLDRKISYGTFQLGPSLRVNPPAMKFDDLGRMVVVHQSGRNRFTRSVVKANRDGAVFVGQTHHLPNGKSYPTAPSDGPLKIED
jgi:hypothetical protein